jgi:hypothetical protein
LSIEAGISSKVLQVNIEKFLSMVFSDEDDLECAKAILISLPLGARSKGKQKQLIDSVVPTRRYHYWRTLKKLLDMQMISKTYGWNENGTRKILYYSPKTDEFVQFLNKLRSAWLDFSSHARAV